MSAIGREAAACPAFRWLRGMHCRPDPSDPDSLDLVIIWASDTHVGWADEDGDIATCSIRDFGRWPDLDDDMTRLGLLALVRKAWRCPTAGVSYNYAGKFWEVVGWAPGDDDECAFARVPTEAAALVAALRAAPEAQP